MKLNLTWKEKLQFVATDGTHELMMDTKPPLGSDTAMTPKQLVVAGLAGCTGIDVAALMRKFRQPIEALEIETDVEKSSGGYPEVFTSALMTFRLRGELDPEKALEAVRLSQTRYCGVSAMLSKAFPIRYRVEVNGQIVGEGVAQFDEPVDGEGRS